MTQKYLTDEIYQKLVLRHRTKVAEVLKGLFLESKAGNVLSVEEAAHFAGCKESHIRRIAREGIFVHYFTAREELSGKTVNKSRMGRPQKMVEIPTLDHLEVMLGCNPKKRQYSIEFDNSTELKAEVVSLPIKRVRGKKGNFANSFLARQAGMSKPTARKYLRMCNRITPKTKENFLSIKEFDEMPVNYDDFKSRPKQHFWKYLEFGGMKKFYSQDGALELMRIAGSIEKIAVITQFANFFEYLGVMSKEDARREAHSVASDLTYLGKMTLQEYWRKFPEVAPDTFTHREHEHLISGMKGADEIMHTREREEEQRILKEVRRL